LAHDEVPNDTSLNVDPEPNFVPTFPDSVRIIACPERYTLSFYTILSKRVCHQQRDDIALVGITSE